VRYSELTLQGVFLVSLEAREDTRGFFSRLFCNLEFRSHGLEFEIVQINNSGSRRAGTLRGLHYQVAPHGEQKLVRCVRGSVFDVAVDLRRSSPTFGHWAGHTIDAASREMMFIPRGCAHGYLTLEDDTELIYATSAPYVSEAERILRWNDPAFSISWPIEPGIISEKDRDAADYQHDLHDVGY
jgi:dTDP-4-dehydrorhamnose 3,5-epimerase